ncbi:hypothetical protein E4N77_09285 [Treponema denticola]|nr:hypothetical protein E4N77_09285 [Treponema denticola]
MRLNFCRTVYPSSIISVNKKGASDIKQKPFGAPISIKKSSS